MSNHKGVHVHYYINLEFSYIEIWENTGDPIILPRAKLVELVVNGGLTQSNVGAFKFKLTHPIYTGTLLKNSDDHAFFDYDYGEIIRINYDQCQFNP